MSSGFHSQKPIGRYTSRPSVLLALNWYSAAIHRGIARYAREAGWSLDISMLRSMRTPSNWQGDGIICTLHMDKALDRLIESARVPTVHIGNGHHSRFPRISADNNAVGSMAADYFLLRGFKHFAFYLRTRSAGEQMRQRAFAKVVRKAGFHFYEIDGQCDKSHSPAAHKKRIRLVAAQIAKLPKPLAVLSEHDDHSIEVIHACLAAKIPIPNEVAVLGVDDDPLRCEFAPVPLSSIDDDQEMIGYKAASALGRLIKGEKTVPKTILIPPRGVTTRLSTDMLAVEHPHVAQALRTIWDHYTEQIDAKQVASTIPMSYRRLHDAFIRHIGHSISEEITIKRIAHARKLLEETGKKTIEIAWLSGFTDHDRMGKVFKRVMSVTPASYRQRFKRAPG